MKILVQKFGGTSVKDEKSRELCINHIKREKENGYSIVVVVSAMGRTGDPYATDTLLSVAKANHLGKREKDLLLSTGELISANVFSSELWRNGIENCVLTGGQAGIITNEQFGEAQIVALKPKKIIEALKSGKIVVVTGFQGESVTGEITTLGRGGSDTSATALGVALEANFVDIFTDVEGVMTADPRIVKDATILESASYTEICNLAHLGAKVIHPRAVEIAMQKNIPIRVRSTFSNSEGTLVANITEINKGQTNMEERMITGITQTANLAQIRISGFDEVATQAEVFKRMEENEISVDFINVSPEEIAYTVSQENMEKVKEILNDMNLQIKIKENCAKVSVVGAGMAGIPGIMAKITASLAEKGIGILQTADSHTTIWVLVEREQMEDAVRTLHNKFSLFKEKKEEERANI